MQSVKDHFQWGNARARYTLHYKVMYDNSQAIAIYIIIVAAWIWHYASQETACLNALYTLLDNLKSTVIMKTLLSMALVKLIIKPIGNN